MISVEMSEPPCVIRVALIGAGIFARQTYVPNLIMNQGRVALTAVLSRSEGPIQETLEMLGDAANRAEKFFGTDGEERFFAIANDICDAVILVVPIPLLGQYVERCILVGLHILSEKPVAMTSMEAGRLIALYRSERRLAMWHVAENYRLEPAVVYARDIVRSHPRRPKSFSLLALRQQSTTSKFAVTTWRATPQYNGSFVLDGGIHFIAMLRTVLGGDVRDIHSIYEEKSVVEVGAAGSCRIEDAVGTFQIRYGAFIDAICGLDVIWDDAVMNIVQVKGVGYTVAMTGRDTQTFPFNGLEEEFIIWLNTITNGEESADLTPEEGLADLLVVEKMCGTTF